MSCLMWEGRNEKGLHICLFTQDVSSSGGSRMETPPPTYDEALVISQATNTPLPLYIALPSGSGSGNGGGGGGEGGEGRRNANAPENV